MVHQCGNGCTVGVYFGCTSRKGENMARGKGEDAIFRRDNGLWIGRIELPPRDGKRRRKEMSSKSKADLLAKMSAARKQFEHQGDLHTEGMTVDAWIDYWMREIAVKTRRPNTVAGYRSHLKWVSKAIGTSRLDKLNAEHVRRVIRLMSDPPATPDNPDPEPMSGTTQRNVHAIMSAMFGDAEREGRISRNPCSMVAAPVRNVADLVALTPEEASRLLATFAGTPDALLWATFILTGGRRGEVIGLEWDRVTDVLDLSWQLTRIEYAHGCKIACGNKPAHCPARTINVPANYEYRQCRGGLYWVRPKTRAGTRLIPLVDPLRSLLEQWRQIAPPNPWGLVFTRPNESGKPLPVDPDFASRVWPEVRKAAGISGNVRLHDLRHTTVDLLYAAGVSEDLIPEIVGHSTRAMSRAYKSKGNQERVAAAMRQMSDMLAVTEK